MVVIVIAGTVILVWRLGLICLARFLILGLGLKRRKKAAATCLKSFQFVFVVRSSVSSGPATNLTDHLTYHKVNQPQRWHWIIKWNKNGQETTNHQFDHCLEYYQPAAPYGQYDCYLRVSFVGKIYRQKGGYKLFCISALFQCVKSKYQSERRRRIFSFMGKLINLADDGWPQTFSFTSHCAYNFAYL